MFPHSRWMIGIGAVALGVLPACNLVIGNEEAQLEEGDGSALEPTVDSDADAAATAEPGSDASGTDPEASPFDPDTSVIDEGATESGDEAASNPWPSDSAHTDSAKPRDAAEERRADVDAARACDAGVSTCAEGQVASEMQACGPCGRGVQTRSRTCAPGGCAWGIWSGWSACSVLTAECMPGQTSSESQACGPCNTGTQARTRSCTASCTWGAWGAFAECGAITAECLPDHWRCCGSGEWEWCYTNRCMWTGGCAACTNCGC